MEEKKEPEWFPNAKVYHNGSHYIAIPHTENKRKKRPKPQEKVFVVSEETDKKTVEGVVKTAPSLPTLEILSDEDYPNCPFDEEYQTQESIVLSENKQARVEKKERKVKLKRVTRSSEFNRLYVECKDKKVKEQKKYLMKGLRRLFPNDRETERYVDGKLMDKYRALVERRKRFMRKAYLNNFDYFATFTYADAKHTEESFKKKLKNCLCHYANRSGWKYMGVWERGGENNRLHFHALLKVPENTMPGELIEVTDFNMKTHRQKKTIQNTFFNERFGRSDFEKIIKKPRAYLSAVEYILKYISKTGERLVYSRGLPMYLISDINQEDVLCRTGLEDKKLVLYDKFGCWDEGEYLGAMSEETKKRMRTTTS
jgi:hypothetical protein